MFRFRSYLVFHVVADLLQRFVLLSTRYDVMFFIILLLCFICVGAIHTGKVNLINRRYHIMVVNILKNRSRKYSNHYIIKFVGFIPIYAINMDIISSFMFLTIFIFDLSIYYKFDSIKLFFLSKKILFPMV